MKINELDEKCGECPLIDYCTEPFCSPQLCAYDDLSCIDVEEYKKIAESITQEEIDEKINWYDGMEPWEDATKGAILDIVIEKLVEIHD